MKSVMIALGLIISINALSQNPIIIPATVEGNEMNLTLQNGTFEFFEGVVVETMGVNGPILGPTLIMNKGEDYQINIANELGGPTTIHWHGMHVPAEFDGGPHTVIEDETTWSPNFTIMDKAGTFWYHPHLHHHTNEHVSKGIAGLVIVRDDEEAALNLPRTYGIDDFPLVIQTKDFNENDSIIISNSDDVLMVNATIDAMLEVPAQVVRFRVLNGSSMRSFMLGLDGGQTFYQIATDGGLLNNSLPLTRLELHPGERAELLIDFSGLEDETINLMSYASEFPNGIYGATFPGMSSMLGLEGYNPNPMNGGDFNLVQFEVVIPTSDPITEVIDELVNILPLLESEADITRDFSLDPETFGPSQLNGNFLINYAPFDMEVINYTIPLNNTEIWVIYNASAISHPFHIHDIQFQILDRDGVAPPPHEQGLKDVVMVHPQEEVRLIMKFEDHADDVIPYMYHCHMLIHEDAGMMGQFLVVDNPDSVENIETTDGFSLFPNPCTGQLYIDLSTEMDVERIEIIDILGKTVMVVNQYNNQEVIDLSKLSAGIHIVKIITENDEFSKKFILE